MISSFEGQRLTFPLQALKHDAHLMFRSDDSHPAHHLSALPVKIHTLNHICPLTSLHLPSPVASPFTCPHLPPHHPSPALTSRLNFHLPSPVAPPPFPCPHLLREVVVDVHVPLAVRAEQVVDVSGPLSQTATAIATAAAIVIVIASAAPFLLLHLSGRRTAIGLQGGREGGERMSVRNERRMRRCGSNPRGVGKEGMAWHAGRR